MRVFFRSPLWCGLLLPPAFATLPLLIAHAQPMRAADPAPLGKTVHFTLDKDEQKDLAITLPPGQYTVIADTNSADDKPTTLFSQIDLLKTNGAYRKPRHRRTATWGRRSG